MKIKTTLAAALTIALAGGCAMGSADESGKASAEYPAKGISILAPGSTGGGWDTRARGISEALTKCKVISQKVTVSNRPGAGGTIGLAEFVKHKGDAHQLIVMDTVTVLGGIATNKSPIDLGTLTPIAGLTTGASTIVVPAKSKYRDLKGLLADFKQDPKGVAWTGGSLGGGDHIQVALLAKRTGVPTDKINYVPTGGGGETVSLLLSGAATAGLATLTEVRSQIEAGELRPLVITDKSGAQPVQGIDAPTLEELGLADATVETVGGVLAPPGISAAEQQAIVSMVDEMRRTDCWKQVLQRSNWSDAWTPGDRFGQLITKQKDQVTTALQELGLAK